MKLVIYSLFMAGKILAGREAGSAMYWPSLVSQCSTAINILKVLNLTYSSGNSDTCCYNGDKFNPVGSFPVAGTNADGVYIGCANDSENRPFISAM